jgi:hypothetical protein
MARNPSGDWSPPERHRTPQPTADPGTYIECDVPPGMTLGDWSAREVRHERPGFGASLREGVNRLARRRPR